MRKNSNHRDRQKRLAPAGCDGNHKDCQSDDEDHGGNGTKKKQHESVCERAITNEEGICRNDGERRNKHQEARTCRKHELLACILAGLRSKDKREKTGTVAPEKGDQNRKLKSEIIQQGDLSANKGQECKDNEKSSKTWLRETGLQKSHVSDRRIRILRCGPW